MRYVNQQSPKETLQYGEAGGMVLGIDASNIRAGGGVTHLVELLRAADPHSNGFSRVIVWGSSATLGRIEGRPWLQKVLDPLLERNLLFRVYWQKFRLNDLMKASRCSILFVPGGTDVSSCRPMVTMSQNLLPFEWRELRRFGVSWVGMKLLLLKITQGRTFRKATGVIFLSRYAQDVVKRVIGNMNSKSMIIPHGIDCRFSRVPRPQRSIGEYSFEQPLRILYVSIIDMYKHQWQVAEAVAQLRAEGFPVTLDLVGPSYRPALERLQATLQRVDPKAAFIYYRGNITYEELHEIYAATDIGVFASSCETFGLILVEAMSAGLPIACSNRGPMPELLGSAGVYFDPEQPDEIAAAIRALIVSPKLRSEKAQAAFERAQQFSWARCSDETFRLLAEVCRDFQRSLRSLPKGQA